MVSLIGREGATEANASTFSLVLGDVLQFPNRKVVQSLFYLRDVFLHSGVSRLEFFVNLSNHQLGVTPNQESIDRQCGRQFEPG